MSKTLSHPIELPMEINNFQLISYLGDRKYLVRSVVCGCTIEKYYSNIISCVNGMCNTCRKEQDALKKKPRNVKRGLIAKHPKTGNTWRAMKGRCLDKNNQDYYLQRVGDIERMEIELEVKDE